MKKIYTLCYASMCEPEHGSTDYMIFSAFPIAPQECFRKI